MDAWEFIVDVLELIRRAFTLDPDALLWVAGEQDSVWLTITIALLAGISVTAGHAVILLVNRISGWHFALGLMVSALGWVALHALESAILWGLASVAAGRDVNYWVVLSAVMVCTAPQVWAFLVLIPYLGPAIGRLLSAWSAVILWVITVDTFGIGPWSALALVAASWLILHGLSSLCGPPLARLAGRLFHLLTGREFQVSALDVMAGRPLQTARVTS